ncbi:hypothetical protein JCM30471_02030 [Desulfuromonas carbonis]|uniref:ABC transporter substrate-binding protein n=1 Tax=Desulfuromonas sp. DDH964 TaxID=1823759 RepID=UPI00078E2528|nr:ABC transporter substrate-binding protein [Desulfuromonas sp. DDH964]AMV71735.1 branched-chain amino acid ABC transporter substrate-binding lipoprotein [Desulfuromonas sp. DDH964]
MKQVVCHLFFWSSLLWSGPAALAAEPSALPSAQPVYIGIDAEFGYRDSTSAEAISYGVQIAIAEINHQGGVLGGRPLKLVERANNSVPARSLVNMEELAAMPDLVAVFCGRFSPPIVAALPLIHQQHLILLDPWAAADGVVENGYHPNYVFRLSLKDNDAMPVMLEHARARGLRRVGLLLLNTSWGRSSLAAAERHLQGESQGLRIVGQTWFNWQDTSLIDRYLELCRAGAEAVIMVTNVETAAVLVREMAALPAPKRIPLLCHWGITGGTFPKLAGTSLAEVDLAVVQTYSFVGATDPVARRVLRAAEGLMGVGARQIPSPVGLAHAYDLTHLLARAIDRAGTTDRPAVRAALEQVRNYQGLVRHFSRPFAPDRHDALDRSDVFMAAYDRNDQAIVPIGR